MPTDEGFVDKIPFNDALKKYKLEPEDILLHAHLFHGLHFMLVDIGISKSVSPVCFFYDERGNAFDEVIIKRMYDQELQQLENERFPSKKHCLVSNTKAILRIPAFNRLLWHFFVVPCEFEAAKELIYEVPSELAGTFSALNNLLALVNTTNHQTAINIPPLYFENTSLDIAFKKLNKFAEKLEKLSTEKIDTDAVIAYTLFKRVKRNKTAIGRLIIRNNQAHDRTCLNLFDKKYKVAEENYKITFSPET
jgi:hypothetical protein